MNQPMLRLFDGFDHTSPELRGAVKFLQNELKAEGFSLEADGIFGRDTEYAVKRFQMEHNLDDDGVVGPVTWSVLLKTVPPDLDAVFPTTLAADNPSMLKQLDAAREYMDSIKEAASQTGIPQPVVGGIGSRESNWGLILQPAGPEGTGDVIPRRFPTGFRSGPLPPDGKGFGRGLMQIDFDSHEFARTSQWQDASKNILYGCQVLSASQEFIVRKTDLKGRDLLRAALAGYNCGPGNVLRALRDGRDVDFYTVGRDYSCDALNRAGFFQLHGWE